METIKTQYYTASSLDGFIAAPGDDLAWLFQFDPPPDMGYDAFIRDVGAIAMGSHTYEWIMRHLVEGDAPATQSSEPPGRPDPSALSALSTDSSPSDLSDLSDPSDSPSSSSELPLPTGAPQPWPYTQPTWVFTSRDLPLPPPGSAPPSGSAPAAPTPPAAPDVRFVHGAVEPVHRAMVEAVGGPDSNKNLVSDFLCVCASCVACVRIISVRRTRDERK